MKILKALAATAATAVTTVALSASAFAANAPMITAGAKNLADGTDIPYQKLYTAQPGEKVLANISVYNTTGEPADLNVRINTDVQNYLSIVPGTAQVFSKNHNGTYINSQDITKQFSIGTFGAYDPATGNGSSTLRFQIQVPTIDKLICGTNTYHWNGQVTSYDRDGKVNSDTMRYDVGIVVAGAPCATTPEEPKQPEEPKTPAKELPITGPAAVVTGITGVAALTTAGAYYIISRKK